MLGVPSVPGTIPRALGLLLLLFQAVPAFAADPSRILRAENPPLSSLDTSKDGIVTPFDAVQVLGYIRLHGAGPPPPDKEHLDVDRDGVVIPQDVLRIINFLRTGKRLVPLEIELTGPDSSSASEILFAWRPVTPDVTIIGYRWRLRKLDQTFTAWVKQTQAELLLSSEITAGGPYLLEIEGQYGGGYWSSTIRHPFTVTRDDTPPTTPVVTDDGVYTTSTTQLHATWTSSDPESGIAEYQYQIRQDSVTGTLLVDWTSAGTATEVTRTGLSLTQGKRYYFGVKARNRAGAWSGVGNSDGIVVDKNAPVITGVTPSDGSTYVEADTVLIAVTATDLDADPLEYQFLVDGVVKRPWVPTASWTWDTAGIVGVRQITVQVRDPYSRQAEETQELFGYRRPRGTP